MPPETQAEQDLYDLSLAQAWPAEQQLALAMEFLRKHALMESFFHHCEAHAYQEAPCAA